MTDLRKVPITPDTLTALGLERMEGGKNIWWLQVGAKTIMVDLDGSVLYRERYEDNFDDLGIIINSIHQLKNLIFERMGITLEYNEG